MAHIRYAGPEAVLDALVDRYPILAPQKEDIRALYELIRQSFASGGKLLVCGNGGSAADALHIVGELMKSFTLPRPIDAEAARLLSERFGQEGERLAASLEGALPAVAQGGADRGLRQHRAHTGAADALRRTETDGRDGSGSDEGGRRAAYSGRTGSGGRALRAV